MSRSNHHSLLAPPLWPFKMLNTQQAADGSLLFNRAGIEHFCELNQVPQGVFLEPEPQALTPDLNDKAMAWIARWNDATPSRHWHLIPGDYQQNQEILVFHWYVIYCTYGCVPVVAYEPHFMNRIQKLAHEAAGIHMHLLQGALRCNQHGSRHPMPPQTSCQSL